MLMLLLCSILPYCEQEPIEELQKAEKTLNDAIEVGAPQYAEQRYFEAEKKLNTGKKLISQKKYKEARNSLIKCAEIATFAIKEATAMKRFAEEGVAEYDSTVQTEAAPVSEEKITAQKPQVTEQYYTVVKGDCLWNIAKRIYGNPLKWKLIYEANKAQINNPDLIYPGQVFVIPPI